MPFDSCSATVAGKASGKSRKERTPRKSSTGQALELQDIAFQDCHNPEVKAHIRAALMRAWVDLEEIVMAKRGIGKPKPVPARNEPKVRTRKGAQPVE